MVVSTVDKLLQSIYDAVLLQIYCFLFLFQLWSMNTVLSHKGTARCSSQGHSTPSATVIRKPRSKLGYKLSQ